MWVVGSQVLQPPQVATHLPLSQQPPLLHLATQVCRPCASVSQQWPLMQQTALRPVPHLLPSVQGWQVPPWQTCVPSQQVRLPLPSGQGV